MVFDSAYIYLETCTTLQAKIAGIDAIITALTASALKAAGTGNLQEYSLDDGQTKIRTAYRNTTEITNAIKSFISIKNIYINQLNGRHMRLVDGKNFR